jgi:hypothetical protein
VHRDIAFASMKDRPRELERLADRHRQRAGSPGRPVRWAAATVDERELPGALKRLVAPAASWVRRPAAIPGHLAASSAQTPSTA